VSILKISIRQIKAARSLLDWSQERLAEASGVSIPTVRRLEAADGELGGRENTAGKIVAALEFAGVEFTNGDQPGVRVRQPLHPYSIKDLVNVIRRFQRNVLSGSEGGSVKFEALNNGFELWVADRPSGTIVVVGEKPVFDPPLATSRTRTDGWVTEDELRNWAQGLGVTVKKAE
jgi:transcriptional regulator with XRE-family HTH domain